MEEMISNAKRVMSNPYFLVIADEKKLPNWLVARHIHYQSKSRKYYINKYYKEIKYTYFLER